MTTETKKSLREIVMSSPLAEKGQLITDSIEVYVGKKRIYDKVKHELDTANGAVDDAVNAYNDARRELFVSLWKKSGFGWCTYGFESNYSNDIHIPDNKGRAVPTGDLKSFYMTGSRSVGGHYGERYTERYTETSVFEVHWLCNECQDAHGERLHMVEEGLVVPGYFNKDGVWTPLDPNTVDLKIEIPHMIPKSLEEDWGIPPKLSIPYEYKPWCPSENHPELVFEPDQ